MGWEEGTKKGEEKGWREGREKNVEIGWVLRGDVY
jgi:hypothetical protein